MLIFDSNGVVSAHVSTILDAATKSGRSDRSISEAAVGSPTALALMRAGREPSGNRIKALCKELGLTFYVGRREGFPELPANTESHAWGDRKGKIVTPQEVPIREGSFTDPTAVGFSPNGCAHFGLGFLLNFELDRDFCEVVEIFDDSMAPEFPAGAAGLVDLRKTEMVHGRVCALGVPELTVRRLRESSRGWLAMADNPEFDTIPWDADCTIIGQVVWTAHMVGLKPAE